MASRKRRAEADLEIPELVAAGSIIANVMQAVASQRVQGKAAAVEAKAQHLLHVLQEWQAAHQKLRHSLDLSQGELADLREEVARLRARNARLEAAAAGVNA